MYLSDYNGRRVDKMSQNELLNYASEAYWFNAQHIFKDRASFAYLEFTNDYQYVVKAIDKRIQLHIDNNYFDDEFYYWKCYRNWLDYLKSKLESLAQEELNFYKSNIRSLPNKDLFLQPLSNRKQEKLFKEELDKAILFADFAYKSFPFIKPQNRIKWEQENTYYRAVFCKAFNETQQIEYEFATRDKLYTILHTRRYDDLSRINYLYSLYHNEEIGNTTYTLYSFPPKDQYDNLIGLNPIEQNPFVTEQIVISEQSPIHRLDISSYYCITAEFFLYPKGKWQSVKSFMEHTAKSLFPHADSAEVHMYEYGYVDFRNKGYVKIGNQTYPFEAEWLNCSPIDEKTKIKHLKIYILSPKYFLMGREVKYVSEMIEQHEPARLLSSVFHDFGSIRIAYKGDCPNPNKAIMLLTLHQAIREGWITSTNIHITSQFESLFYKTWERYVSSHCVYKPLFEDTLYRLKSEPFWTLLTKSGEADNDKLNSKQISKNDFTERYCDIILEDIHFIALCNNTIADVIDDILLKLFDSKAVKFNQRLDEIIKEKRKQHDKVDTAPKFVNTREIITDTPYPIPKGIVEIEARAYEKRKDIVDLIIPEGVKSIGNLAFTGCTNMRSVSLPNSLVEIGNGAFKNCHNLKYVTFGNKLKTLGVSAFSRCGMLQDFILPKSLRDIGARAFCYCSSLQKVIIPSKVYGTGDRSFAFCTSLTDLTIAEGVGQIDHESFLGCLSLSTAIIPASVHWVGNNPFGQTVLKRISFAEGNDTCYLNPYTGISSLTEIEIPASCTYISTPFVLSVIKPQEIIIQEENMIYAYINGVLYNKKQKELVYCRKDSINIEILSGTRSIGAYAFAHCEQLQEVIFPSSVVKIDGKAFMKCKKLKKVIVPNEKVSHLLEKELKCQIIIRTN